MTLFSPVLAVCLQISDLPELAWKTPVLKWGNLWGEWMYNLFAVPTCPWTLGQVPSFHTLTLALGQVPRAHIS